MWAQSILQEPRVRAPEAPGASLNVRETSWGFSIRPDVRWSNRAAQIEKLCVAAGLVCLLAALGSWMFPQVHASVAIADVLSVRVASGLTLALPALLFLWASDRGLGSEVQIDVVKGCLRRGILNRKGKFRDQHQVRFSEINSAFVKRTGGSCKLFVRLKNNKVIYVASGSENALRQLHDRLNRVLQPVRTQMPGWDRVGRRLLPAAVH